MRKFAWMKANDSPARRWTVMVIVSVVMMIGYVFWDIVSPLSTMLKAPVGEGGMGWTAAEYGFYAGSYSIFNIFLLMLFFGGVILDKCGIRFTGILATGMMLGGAMVNWYALSHIDPTTCVEMPVFGLIPSPPKAQVLVSALGFGLFGVGCDITGITVSKVITKWFTGHELASAMGLQVALARLGTALAISLSPVIALSFGLSASLLVGVFLLLLGFLMFFGYTFMDRQIEQHQKEQKPTQKVPFSRLLRNKGYWLIALLCVLFYTSIRPFLKFATDVLISKYGIDPVTAGWIVSLLPYGTIILTPLFGSIYDRFGRGATLMLAGCSLVLCSHVLLALPMVNSTWVATLTMILLGVAFSLVPSAMWPSVPKLVPIEQLGTAYSIIYFIQNIGLMLMPMYIGNLIDQHVAADGRADMTAPMSVFALFALAAVAVAALLLWADRREDYGLERANIVSKERT